MAAACATQVAGQARSVTSCLLEPLLEEEHATLSASGLTVTRHRLTVKLLWEGQDTGTSAGRLRRQRAAVMTWASSSALGTARLARALLI